MLCSKCSWTLGRCLGGLERKAGRAEGPGRMEHLPSKCSKSNWDKHDNIIYSRKLRGGALVRTQTKDLLKDCEGRHMIKGKSQGPDFKTT